MWLNIGFLVKISFDTGNIKYFNMETIEITVLDYYNRPGYYPFMPKEIFDILEAAFLEDKVSVEVPKMLFDEMLIKVNKTL